VPNDLSELGTALRVHLPDTYADTPGQPVEAHVVEMPFRESVNPNTRERLRQKGLDAAV
jgi:aminomethyltransferase